MRVPTPSVGPIAPTRCPTTSFLTATTLIYAIGAGITAAAGTRLALQLILDKGFELFSFQLPDLYRPGIVIYCHYLHVSWLGNLRACCLPWMWSPSLRLPLRCQTLIFRYPLLPRYSNTVPSKLIGQKLEWSIAGKAMRSASLLWITTSCRSSWFPSNKYYSEEYWRTY